MKIYVKKTGVRLLYLFLFLFMSETLFARTVTYSANSSATYSSLWAANDILSSSSTLVSNNYISASKKLIFDTSGTSLDGNGYSLTFPSLTSTPTSVLVINDGVSATITNSTIDNINFGLISVGAGSSLVFGNNTSLFIKQDQTITSAWSFAGSTIIQGSNNILDVSGGGSFAVQAGGVLKISNLILKGVSSSTFSCANNTASIIFENTTLNVPSACSITTGSFIVKGAVEVSGGGTLSIAGSTTNTIDVNSNLIFSNNSTLNYSPSIASQSLLSMTDKTSVLSLINSTLTVSTTGLQLTKGTLYVDGGSSISSAATVESEGIYFGDGISSSNDLDVDLQPGTPLNLTSGILVYKNLVG